MKASWIFRGAAATTEESWFLLSPKLSSDLEEVDAPPLAHPVPWPLTLTEGHLVSLGSLVRASWGAAGGAESHCPIKLLSKCAVEEQQHGGAIDWELTLGQLLIAPRNNWGLWVNDLLSW